MDEVALKTRQQAARPIQVRHVGIDAVSEVVPPGRIGSCPRQVANLSAATDGCVIPEQQGKSERLFESVNEHHGMVRYRTLVTR